MKSQTGGVSIWSRRKNYAAVLALGIVPLLAVSLSTVSSASSLRGGSATHAGIEKTAVKPGVAAAERYLAASERPVVWRGPTKPVRRIGSVRGKSVDIVNLTQEIPALAEWADTAQAQLRALGVRASICDAGGSPTGIVSCMQQGISEHPNVLIALALNTTFIQKYVTQAKAAGIKVITGQTGVPGRSQAKGALAEVTFNYPEVGHILGAWFAAQSHCSGYPQIITSTSSAQPSAAEVKGIQRALTQYCPGDKARPVQNVLIPNWATQLPTLTRSDLLANPSLDYLLPLYDGMTIYMLPAIEQTNVGRTIKVASFNATPVVMQTELARHTDLAADIGGPNRWYAYALTDETLRVLTGSPVVVNENVPLRMFDSADLAKINVHNSSTWYGPVNWACDYHKLWGESCK
ncbi:MAG: substrate-binding domain-containing protein [Actinomycetota bacterium]|nr:substrate-binding domain-containing protein [Actinomycetota bacterium]